MEVSELVEDRGLVGVLRFADEALRLAAEQCPTWGLSQGQVGEAVGLAQRVRDAAQVITAVSAREAHSRGLAAAEGLSAADWLRTQAPTLDPREAPGVAKVAAAMTEPRWAALAAKVTSGATSVAQAAMIVRFHADLARIADPEHLQAVVDAMVEVSDVLSAREMARVAAHGRASMRPPADLADEDRAMRAGRAFKKIGETAGFIDYLLRLDPEAAAVIEAAIDPLARPRPDLDWGGDTTADPRRPETRRADALLEIVGRGVAAPEGVTRTPRTQLVVTMTMEALMERLRGAGVCDNDAVLSPATVRRLACEAAIIPMVLGGRSQVLDQGYTERYFTPAQRRALTRRDGGCTFPGCTVPPQWCDAHHVTHWADGGRTDLANGALLCGRHHTVVHERGMTATVTTTAVTWHR
ncbi:uncharacterized protein DUF222 [Humibacillus xanthopallidus]|uniref:Uncharacterized protein DUF222 n=2 Tax=Humibacillus xanthopallidus TaxID=412689 RepID=A0A543PWI7_9MICO|nr:HNH endonuclease signature motif containing protein [Humibacillus xanthopallidus]TQN48442.1 uncharacterized protein DUF222 [Humibacillus xanthopallidus]